MATYTAREVISTPGALDNVEVTEARELMDHWADSAPEPVTYGCTVEEVAAEMIARRDDLRAVPGWSE